MINNGPVMPLGRCFPFDGTANDIYLDGKKADALTGVTVCEWHCIVVASKPKKRGT